MKIKKLWWKIWDSIGNLVDSVAPMISFFVRVLLVVTMFAYISGLGIEIPGLFEFICLIWVFLPVYYYFRRLINNLRWGRE